MREIPQLHIVFSSRRIWQFLAKELIKASGKWYCYARERWTKLQSKFVDVVDVNFISDRSSKLFNYLVPVWFLDWSYDSTIKMACHWLRQATGQAITMASLMIKWLLTNLRKNEYIARILSNKSIKNNEILVFFVLSFHLKEQFIIYFSCGLIVKCIKLELWTELSF